MPPAPLLPRAAAAVAALLAAVVTVTSATTLGDVADDQLVAQAWRAVGLATWTALFGVLVALPRLLALWLVALASKLALVAVGLALGPDVPGASDLVLWDGILSVVLAAGVAGALRARGSDRARPSP